MNIRDLIFRLKNPGRELPRFAIRMTGKHTYLVLASIVVGAASGLAAVAMKMLVDLMRELPEYFFRVSKSSLLFFILPVLGIILAVLFVRIFLKGKLEKGLGSLIFAISKKKSVLDRSQIYSPVITSGITVGFGGSAGLEAPIVMTGSAIGSNLARYLRFNTKERTLLLACGAAAGISAIFNSPIAGVLFAVEVLLSELSIPLFIPLLISAAAASIISQLLYSGQLFHLITTDWHLNAIPFYIGLGILCGLVSVYVTRTALHTEEFLDRRRHVWLKAIGGGILLGAMIFVFPPLFGEGYDTVTSLLNGSYGDLAGESFYMPFANNAWLVVAIAFALILIKPFAYAVTVGSGGNGGIFAPSLFLGALVGFVFARVVNLTGIQTLLVTNFVAVGMAGMMSGVVYAPLTAIFLIAEITGGYMLFIPLMIVSATSYFIARFFEPHSVYVRKLVDAGLLNPDDKDMNILDQLKIDEMLETEFATLEPGGSIHDLKKEFARSGQNMFPVADGAGRFLGVIFLDDVKELLFTEDGPQPADLSGYMKKDVPILELSEEVSSAMRKFENCDLDSIPVTEQGRFMGFVSRSTILSHYRKVIRKSTGLA